jgi:nucleoside-triphosphatase
MGVKLLLTGTPGCGKTTLLRKVLAQLPAETAGGFYTQEIRTDSGRVGFEILTLSGRWTTLAHVNLKSSRRVGRYGVNLNAVDEVAVPALLEAQQMGRLVVIDEIGPMETFSRRFCQTVEAVLCSPAAVFGTVVLRPTPFGDRVKALPGVRFIQVTPHNRDELMEEIVRLLLG